MGVIVALTAGQVDLARREVRRHDGTVCPLSATEARLLARLVAGAPATVPHAELATGALDARIARLRAKIEREPRRPEHLLTTFGAGYRLVGARVVPPLAGGPLVGPGALYGRDELLARLAGEDARCVWLWGPPGVGKTTLARAALAGQPGVLVDLARAVDLAEAVASACGVPRAELAPRLASARGAWLFLDNAEALHDALAPTLGPWLAEDGVRVLVTSRLACSIPGAAAIAVPPLDDSAAEALLRDRAADLRPGLPADRPTEVAELLRQLGGLPLAIELAAARLSALPVGRLAGLASSRVDVLANRVRSLEGAIASSWDALPPADQRALAVCSLFQGPFGADDVAELLGCPASAALERLARASLVAGADRDRFELLAPIRTFARARLPIDRADLTAIVTAFTAWLDPERGDGPRQDRLLRHFPERQTALELARSVPVPAVLSTLTLGVTNGLEIVGVAPRQRAEVVRTSLAVPALGAGQRARLLAQLGGIVDGAEGLAIADQAVALAPADDVGARSMAIAMRGSVAAHVGRLSEAEEDLRRSLDLERPESPYRLAWHLRGLAEVVRRQGRVREARDVLGEALAYSEKSGAPGVTVFLFLQLAAAEAWLGRYAAAERHRAGAADWIGRTATATGEFNALCARGAWARERGDLDVARHHYLQALTIPSIGAMARWHTEGNVALIEEIGGDPVAAEARLDRVEDGLRAVGDEAYAAETSVNRLRVVMQLGDVARAEEVLGTIPDGLEVGTVVEVAGLAAELAATRGDEERARAWLRQGEAAVAPEMVDAGHRLAIQRWRVERRLGARVPAPEVPEIAHAASLRAFRDRPGPR